MSVSEARELAVRAHGDQRDRDGSLHIDHVARVAEAVEPSAEYQRVAWLHDVLEDSELGTEGLARLPKAELGAVVLLTHSADVSYEDYIDTSCGHRVTPAALRERSRRPTCSTTCAAAPSPGIPPSGSTGKPWRSCGVAASDSGM